MHSSRVQWYGVVVAAAFPPGRTPMEARWAYRMAEDELQEQEEAMAREEEGYCDDKVGDDEVAEDKVGDGEGSEQLHGDSGVGKKENGNGKEVVDLFRLGKQVEDAVRDKSPSTDQPSHPAILDISEALQAFQASSNQGAD